MSKLSYIWILLTLYSHIVYAQSSTNVSSIHFDKSFYIVGDTAWFQAFLPPTFRYDQSIANVLLINAANEIVSDFYLPIYNLSCAGYFHFSHTNSTGTYQAIIHLQEEGTQSPYIIISHAFIVLNQNLPTDNLWIPLKRETSHLKKNQLFISITPNQSIVSPRSLITLQIEVKDRNGLPLPTQLSMAVTEDHGIDKLSNYSLSSVSGFDRTIENNIVLKGKVNNIEFGKPLENTYVAVFHQETGATSIIDTDGLGHFRFEIAPFEGKQHIQLWDLFERNIRVEFKDKRWQLPDQETKQPLDIPQFQSFIRLNSERKKINYVFGHFNPKDAEQQQPTWRHLPDDSLRPEDYESYPDFPSIFENLIAPLKMRRKNKTIVPRMLNPETKKVFSEAPIFIIDHAIGSFQDVLALEMSEIDQIDFYNQTTTLSNFGPLGRNGVVFVRTIFPKKDNFLKNTQSIYGLQKPIGYPRQIALKRNPHLPSFNSLIYWNPDITTDEVGKATITFSHSDEIGRFEIRVLGRSEGGEIGTQEMFYEVTLD